MGFHDAHRAGLKIGRSLGLVEDEVVADHSRKIPAVLSLGLKKSLDVRFAREGGEGSDSKWGASLEMEGEVLSDGGRVSVGSLVLLQFGPKSAAPCGLVGGWITCRLHGIRMGLSIVAVTRFGQVVIFWSGMALSCLAEENKKPFLWNEPRVGAGAFSDALGMLDREREEYATNLAVHAINEVAKAKASVASLEKARRLLALSLHLSPRNRRALVANYQLNQGMVPEPVSSDYSDEVLARLLFTRSQLLRQQGGGEDQELARIFVELAAELDPKNEDAVYASELQRLDHGRVDWKLLTDVKSSRNKSPMGSSEEEGAADDLP